mgnify:CR=1 FL=1
MKRACVLLADGCEEVEAITPIDYLRRAGIAVVTAGIAGRSVTAGHGITIAADRILEEIHEETFECVIVPGGGKGSENIARDGKACRFITRHAREGALIAAICAAPALVLGQACGLLRGKVFTCYPGMEKLVPEGNFRAERVVRDRDFVTARGPGCAGDFALALVEILAGKDKAESLRKDLLL